MFGYTVLGTGGSYRAVGGNLGFRAERSYLQTFHVVLFVHTMVRSDKKFFFRHQWVIKNPRLPRIDIFQFTLIFGHKRANE